MSSAANTMDIDPMDEQASVQLVTFSLAEELFALDILKVQEIIRVSLVTPVPHMPGFVDGVITLRGKIVPVIDLRTRFGLMRTEHAVDTRIIVINVKQILLGLVVDAVHEVTRLADTQIQAAGAMGTGTNEYVHAVGKLDGRLVTLVDVEAIGVALGNPARAA